jgi:hypothetical protein
MLRQVFDAETLSGTCIVLASKTADRSMIQDNGWEVNTEVWSENFTPWAPVVDLLYLLEQPFYSIRDGNFNKVPLNKLICVGIFTCAVFTWCVAGPDA